MKARHVARVFLTAWVVMWLLRALGAPDIGGWELAGKVLAIVGVSAALGALSVVRG